MFIKSKNDKDEIVVSIPLTTQTEKTRIKRRSILNQYGLPVATRSETITQDCYVEWQIGYDVVISEAEKLKMTTLKQINFMGANGKEKAFYELSEYVYYFTKWGIIDKKS
jgi:carboxypeptidase C (cathepsin A)